MSTPEQIPPANSTPAPETEFVHDNFWPSRREGNLGLAELPPAALQPQIKKISVQYDFLSTISPEIGQLKLLEELAIFDAELNDVPSEIEGCERLKIVALRQCHLTTLPSSFFHLRRLEVLDLSWNKIALLPEEIGRLGSLRELILHQNPLTMLPASLGQLSKLEILGVACSKLENLPESILELPNLQEVVLRNWGPCKSLIERWTELLPKVNVRFATESEIARKG